MEAKTLHLVLIRQYFDMIAALIKKEEYRAITPFWGKRFLATIGLSCQFFNENFSADGKLTIPNGYYKKFDTVTFTNGYAKNARRMVLEFKGIEIKEGNPAWGAEPGVKYFAIQLGKIISKNF